MSFGENDSSFSFDCKPLASEHVLKTGLWLLLIGINEIPPHVALINEGKYYSLSTRRVDCGSSLEKLMTTFSRKKIPCIFFNLQPKFEKENTFALLQNIYTRLHPLDNMGNTCLSPIKEFFEEYYFVKFASVNYVFELLALAEKKGLIKECISLYAEDKGSNSITLPKYTMAQIRNKIRSLSAKSEITYLKS